MNMKGFVGDLICFWVVGMVSAVSYGADESVWVTEGFEQFRRGNFGNGGENLYVSRAGGLQRIHQFDLDHNGYLDLPFANCQDHNESAPSYVYSLDGKRTAMLPGMGSWSGLVADLNGDGFQDVVVCGNFSLLSPFVTTEIYYGSKDGVYSEKYHIRLQSPRTEDCACGDFNGSGRPSLVFAMPGFETVRIYSQDELGFEWTRFTDLKLVANLLTACDLDGDGFDDLVLRGRKETRTTVLWGGPKGLDLSALTELPELPASEVLQPEEEQGLQSEFEKKFKTPRLLESVKLWGRNTFTLSTGKKVLFYSADRQRRLECVLEIPQTKVNAVAVGDFDSDGNPDLAFATDMPHPTNRKKQQSFVWFGSKEGYDVERRVALDTVEACCVAVDGRKVLFGCGPVNRRYTNDALLYTFADGRFCSEPRRYVGEDVRRACFVKHSGREPDIFLVNHYSRSSVGFDKTYVYMGDKDGYRADRRVEVPGWCAVDTVMADFDDDGWTELLVCNNSENSLDLDPGHHLHHFGPNGFEPERTQTLKTDIGWGAFTGDFDRDGWLDIVCCAEHSYDLRFYYGGPDGFKRVENLQIQQDDTEMPGMGSGLELAKQSSIRHPSTGSVRWPLAVDLNRDGWLDIVVPMINFERSHVLWGGPQGFSMERRQDLVCHRCVSARTADLDKNGWPDLILGGHTYQSDGKALTREPHSAYLHVYWNGPEGLSECRKSLLRCDAGDTPAVADFNNDGWLDIFIGTYQGDVDRDINSFIYWNRQGTFAEYDRQDLITHAVSGCVAADFNQDGYVDLATANHKIFGDHKGESYVWWNGPQGFVTTNITRLPTCGPHGMTSVEPGNQLTRCEEEFYESEPRQIMSSCIVSRGEVTATCPTGTWVRVEVRAAATKEGLEVAVWREPKGLKTPAGSFLQYRLALGAKLSLRTPRVTRVEIGLKADDKKPLHSLK